MIPVAIYTDKVASNTGTDTTIITGFSTPDPVKSTPIDKRKCPS